MKHSHGQKITTIIPISILAFVAALGWYYYYSETNKNQSLATDSRTEQGVLNNKLEQQQATIDKLQEDETTLQARLASGEVSRQELTDRLEKAMAELETELEKRQTTIKKLQDEATALQATLAQ